MGELQVVRRFSVARETVRSALKDLLDKKLVERRPGYGTFLADLAETKAATAGSSSATSAVARKLRNVL